MGELNQAVGGNRYYRKENKTKEAMKRMHIQKKKDSKNPKTQHISEGTETEARLRRRNK